MGGVQWNGREFSDEKSERRLRGGGGSHEGKERELGRMGKEYRQGKDEVGHEKRKHDA